LNNLDAPLGQLPYLTTPDNLKMPQSLSIARFLAKKYNLAGGDDITQVKCDVVVDTLSDLRQAYYNIFSQPKEHQAEAMKKFFAEDAPKHLGNIEKLIGMYGSNGHSVGNSITWADLFIQDVTHTLHVKDAHVLDKFPHVAKVKQTVESHPKIAAWLKARPENTF